MRLCASLPVLLLTCMLHSQARSGAGDYVRRRHGLLERIGLIAYTTEAFPGEATCNHDLRIVTETWRSPDLQIELDRTVDDPRMGKSTTLVTSLQRAQPDPALFQIPSDYKVDEQSGSQR